MASIVQFAKEYEKLKSDLSVSPTDGLKLLRMIEFWSHHGTELRSSAYHTYLADFSIICEVVSEESLHDLSIEEFIELKDALGTIVEFSTGDRVRSLAEQKLKMVMFSLVKTLCYVGDLSRALPLAAELSGSQEVPRFEEATSAQTDSFEALTSVTNLLEKENPTVSEILVEVQDRWEAERECISDDRALCVLVENDPTTGRSHGIMGTLQGMIEQRQSKRGGGDSVIDTVTFGNQLRAQDDPLAIVLYNSLEAVRSLPKRFDVADNAKDGLHAYFSIPGSSGVFTGGSLGFAAGVLTYSQLLKPIILRERRFVPASVAFTGTLDSAGAIGSVNNSTLRDKISRAFFSHVEMLAIPEANLHEAKTHLKELSDAYPLRYLRLVAFERLADSLSSHDIMRSEKVCFGEFAARKAASYSRRTGFQVPLLTLLLYMLICVAYPKAWVAFDRNPASVELTRTGFEVLNRNSVNLWSKNFECKPLDSASERCVYDLDGDGKNEVLFIPATPENASCKPRTVLYAYDDDGDSLFTAFCPIIGETPCDTNPHHAYNKSPIEIVGSKLGTVIVTQAYSSHEARTHFKFWNPSGELLGWYINAGHMAGTGDAFASDADGRLYFLTYNNIADCTCLFIVKPDSCSGTSPPYTGFLSDTKIGTQLHYVVFPRTDVNDSSASIYNHPIMIVMQLDGRYRVDIRETDGPKAVLEYYFDKNHRVVEVRHTDGFWNMREDLVRDGKLPPITRSYFEDMRDSVRYWTESGWVSEGELRSFESSEN